MKYLLASIFISLLGFAGNGLLQAQSSISIEDCGVSYIDPQDAIEKDAPSHDTVIYSTYFQEQSLLRTYFVDINAFGGRQVDRASVFAIMPGDTLKFLGDIAFGNCVDCVQGFALVKEDSLLVKEVSDRSTMDLWLQSLNQPSFALTSNLQTLVGVGRLSGTLPPCAIGLHVECVVYSNPNSTSTEFSMHVLCPEVIRPCQIQAQAELDCQKDSIYLRSEVPLGCFSENAKITWRNDKGMILEASEAVIPLSGNEGMYYLSVEDECCVMLDSILVENPSFAEAGPDRKVCQGGEVILEGSGGQSYYWEQSDGATFDGASLSFPQAEEFQSGHYVLHAFNEEGCEDTDTLFLNVQIPAEPEVLISDACLGDTVRFSLENENDFSQIDWFNQQGIPLPSPIIIDLHEPDFGTYSISTIDTTGCPSSATFEVSGSLPPAFDFSIEESCDSAWIYLYPEDYLYEWEDGTEGAQFATNTGGLFQLSITDSLGCRTLETIEIPEPDGPNINLSIEHPRCPNEFGAIELNLDDPNLPAIFSIDGGNTYTLDTRFEELPPGTYEILVQDEFACIQTFTAELIAPDTMGVEIKLDDLEVRPGTPVKLEASIIGNIERIQWLPESIDSGTPTTEFIANDNLDVRIIVEDERACLASDGFQLTIVLGDIYAPNAFSPDGDRNNDTFILYSDNGSGELIEFLRIYDRYGTLLFEQEEIPLNAEEGGWNGDYRGKPMNTGVYVYHAQVRFGNGATKELMGDVTLIRQ